MANTPLPLTNTKHKWADKSRYKNKADANDIYIELNAIASRDPDGKAKNSLILDFAERHKTSAIGKCLEWDDSKASRLYRLRQIQDIKDSIISYTVKPVKPSKCVTSGPIEVKTMHALPDTPGKGHKAIENILLSKPDTNALEKRMYDSIRQFIKAFHTRYNVTPNFDAVYQLLLDVEKKLPTS